MMSAKNASRSAAEAAISLQRRMDTDILGLCRAGITSLDLAATEIVLSGGIE